MYDSTIVLLRVKSVEVPLRPKICHVDVLLWASIARACQWYPPFIPVKVVVAKLPERQKHYSSHWERS